MVLIVTLCDFQQMITKLGFDWSLNFSNGGAEDHGVEFLYHLTAAEFTQLATLACLAIGTARARGRLTGASVPVRAVAVRNQRAALA